MHDPRVRKVQGQLVDEHHFEVYGGGIYGVSPQSVELPPDEGETKSSGQVKPYGFEGYLSAVLALAHAQGNTRLSFGLNSSFGNQASTNRTGQQASENFEPRVDDASQEGHLVWHSDLSKKNVVYMMPTFELDTVLLLPKRQRLMMWMGSHAQGMNVWNFPVVTAKTDDIYFHTSYTFLGAGLQYFVERDRWDLGTALSFRHANDADLILWEENSSVDIHRNWCFSLLLYGGLKWPTPPHTYSKEDGFERDLGTVKALGGGVAIDSPHDETHPRPNLKIGFTLGSLHNTDQGFHPSNGIASPLPQHHYLATPYILGNIPLKKGRAGELGAKVATYHGIKNDAAFPGAETDRTRSLSLEALLQWKGEFLQGRQDYDVRVALVYLREAERFWERGTAPISGAKHMAIGIVEFHFGGSYRLTRKPKSPTANPKP